MSTKEKFHQLIDAISDEKLLSSYYALIRKLHKNQTGELWKSLSPDEQDELLVAYEESFDAQNLVPHEEVKTQHEKWLKK